MKAKLTPRRQDRKASGKAARVPLRSWRLCAALGFFAGSLLVSQSIVTLEIEHDRVTAQDLARALPPWKQAPPETAVLYAPLPGLSRELTGVELARLAARHGVSVDAGHPERLRIVRRLRRLEREEAEAALAASLARRFRISPEDIAVELIAFQGPMVPAGELRFRSGESVGRPGEVSTVPLTWSTPERRSGTLWLRARLQVRGQFAVAARVIGPRTPVDAAAVAIRDGILDLPPDRWIARPAEVVGKSLARSVGAGEKIPRAWVLSPKAIERGAVVELRLARGPIELRAPGRAEQAASIGERVPFRNLATGRRVTGQVTDARSAEVLGPRMNTNERE